MTLVRTDCCGLPRSPLGTFEPQRISDFLSFCLNPRVLNATRFHNTMQIWKTRIIMNCPLSVYRSNFSNAKYWTKTTKESTPRPKSFSTNWGLPGIPGIPGTIIISWGLASVLAKELLNGQPGIPVAVLPCTRNFGIPLFIYHLPSYTINISTYTHTHHAHIFIILYYIYIVVCIYICILHTKHIIQYYVIIIYIYGIHIYIYVLWVSRFESLLFFFEIWDCQHLQHEHFRLVFNGTQRMSTHSHDSHGPDMDPLGERLWFWVCFALFHLWDFVILRSWSACWAIAKHRLVSLKIVYLALIWVQTRPYK